MSEQNKTVVRRHLEELWNLRNLALADELVTSDCRNIDPSTPDLGSGPEAYKKLVQIYTGAFADLHFAVNDLFGDGDSVVARWTATGHHTGELNGIPATKKQFKCAGVTICHLRDGKIAELWVNWDALGLFQQLGLIPDTQNLRRAA